MAQFPAPDGGIRSTSDPGVQGQAPAAGEGIRDEFGGVLSPTGTISSILGGVVESAAGEAEVDGAIVSILGGVVEIGLGFAEVDASGVSTLGGIVELAIAKSPITATAESILGGIVSQAEAGSASAGHAESILGPVVMGATAFTYAPARATQLARLTLTETDPDGRAGQLARLAISEITVPGRATQLTRLSVEEIQVQGDTTQLARLIVAGTVDCVTKWCQLWKIKRRDGQIFRFTSLDSDLEYGAEIYKSCGSLMPSASEESSEVGSVSSIELTGILSDESITEGDLYGGLYDDAFVTIWLVPFEGVDIPRRLAAGWIGAVQHGEKGWTGEITGPGSRLDQQALVVPFAPPCRWTFGDSRCTKDLTALQTAGVVLAATNRGAFVSDAPEPGLGSQWENGRVIWQTGRNAGLTCEVKTADFGGSADTQIVLWALAAFLPEPGDEFIMQPGCDLSAGTCKNVYSNHINFGGFEDVPGNDSIVETPISKIDS